MCHILPQNALQCFSEESQLRHRSFVIEEQLIPMLDTDNDKKAGTSKPTRKRAKSNATDSVAKVLAIVIPNVLATIYIQLGHKEQ